MMLQVCGACLEYVLIYCMGGRNCPRVVCIYDPLHPLRCYVPIVVSRHERSELRVPVTWTRIDSRSSRTSFCITRSVFEETKHLNKVEEYRIVRQHLCLSIKEIESCDLLYPGPFERYFDRLQLPLHAVICSHDVLSSVLEYYRPSNTHWCIRLHLSNFSDVSVRRSLSCLLLLKVYFGTPVAAK